jgi:hypothetical protein
LAKPIEAPKDESQKKNLTLVPISDIGEDDVNENAQFEYGHNTGKLKDVHNSIEKKEFKDGSIDWIDCALESVKLDTHTT